MAELTNAQLLDMVADLRHTVDTLQGKLAAAEKKQAATEEKLTTMTKQRNDDIVEKEIVRPALAMGLIPEAITDISGAAIRDGWTMNKYGELELRDPKTGEVATDVTPTSWVQSQANGPRKKYFQNAQTSGGGGSAGGFEGKNPWSKDGWDDMEQAKIFRTNPDKAHQLAAAAGSRVGALPPDQCTKTPY